MAESEATITISAPDTITVRMWNEYCKARQAYFKANPDGNGAMADFAASQALIKAQWFKLTAPDSITTLLSGAVDDVPLPLIGFINREIAGKVDAAMLSPLESLTGKS